MKKYYRIFFILFVIILISGCASIKPEKKEIITGIKGVVIPVDEKGNEITQQDKEKIIINVIKINEGNDHGSPAGSSITINPKSNGEFFIKLDSGEYSIEVFLEGFYVRSFKIKIENGEIIDLGRIILRKIETESASPVKGENNVGSILNEGDVNIQPPTY